MKLCEKEMHCIRIWSALSFRTPATSLAVIALYATIWWFTHWYWMLLTMAILTCWNHFVAMPHLKRAIDNHPLHYLTLIAEECEKHKDDPHETYEEPLEFHNPKVKY